MILTKDQAFRERNMHRLAINFTNVGLVLNIPPHKGTIFWDFIHMNKTHLPWMFYYLGIVSITAENKNKKEAKIEVLTIALCETSFV